MEAARGTKEETWGPKSAKEATTIAKMRMNIDGTITRYEDKNQGEGKIEDWLTRHGWRPDTPLREGGLRYPIWPKMSHMFKGSRKKRRNKKDIKFIKGPSLEEEMSREKEQQNTKGDIEIINEEATKKWQYYALERDRMRNTHNRIKNKKYTSGWTSKQSKKMKDM